MPAHGASATHASALGKFLHAAAAHGAAAFGRGAGNAAGVGNASDVIWTQREGRQHGQSDYMQRVLRQCMSGGERVHALQRRPILNIGIIGGERAPLLRVLQEMVRVMTGRNLRCLRRSAGLDVDGLNPMRPNETQ